MKKWTTIPAVAGIAIVMAVSGCSREDMRQTEATTERTVSNASLTASVKSKLAADVRLGTLTSINVDSAGSVVTLSGTVRSNEEKDWAEKVAASVDGVTDVTNNLEVQEPK